VIHNSITKETIILPAQSDRASELPSIGGGYLGADGGEGEEEFPASFGTMSEITNTQDPPWRMNVKLVGRMGSSYYVCSGTMRDAETVLTAGHCVYDYGGYGWADEIWVYPGWDGVGGQFNPPPSVINPYGYGRGTYFGSWTGWTNSGDYNNDVGLVGVTRAVGSLTGWFGWAADGDCSWHLDQVYNNTSYPAESCASGLHTGTDMYYWSGRFDSCPSWNRLQVDTTPGCFTAVWGGMSGSGAYYIEGDGRYVHGVCSTSDRSTYGRYARQWGAWVDYSNNTFIPNVRGSSFDLQALDVNASPTSLRQGQSTTLLNHLAANPTNGSANGTWTYRVYLSTNDNISSTDTLLSTQNVSWSFGPMSTVRVNMVQVTIPYNTPPGSYWLGLEYDSGTDGDASNNDTDTWDAVAIQVLPEITSPTPNPMTWATEPYELNTTQISMTASTASDPTGPITYFFQFYSSPTGGAGGTSSAWQSSTAYSDSGLSANHQYGYRVKARDGNLNETSYSSISYDYTDIETPSGITFGAITAASIEARSTNTPSGLTRGSSGLLVQNYTRGTNSGWKQDNGLWNSTGLTPNTNYSFRAQARNGDGDATAWSALASRYTLANLPSAAAFSNITSASIQANWGANGNPAGTQFYCENTTAGTNSGWITATSWNSTGLSSSTPYSFRVKARNGNSAETGWVSLGSATTLPPGDVCECDLVKDGKCNILDYQLFIQDWGRSDCNSPGVVCECDLNKDGKCNILDYQIFIQDWGRSDCP
jgi:hypothetical protein